MKIMALLTSAVRRECHDQEGWGTFNGHVFEVPELCSATFEVHSSYIYVECSATVPDRDSRAQCPPGLEVDTVSINRCVFNIFLFIDSLSFLKESSHFLPYLIYENTLNKLVNIGMVVRKSRIRETPNLSTNVDSSTDIFVSAGV